MEKDMPLERLERVAVLHEKDDTKVELVKLQDVLYVLKSFNRAKVMDKEGRSEELVNERDLLKMLEHKHLNGL